jgi:glycerol kinase
MKTILAIDQGTTGTTALVLSEDGTLMGRGYRAIGQYFPRPGWVEHDPEELVRSALDAGREAIARAGVTPEVLGLTNQRETVVLWDRRTLAPTGHAIVWQDRRTAPRCRELRDAGLEARIGALTGLVPDPYFSATKLEWLLRDDDLRRRAFRGELAAGTVDSWLVAKLTGGRAHVTDHTNASRTMLYDLDRRDWSEELLVLFGIPREILPAIVRSSQVVGEAEAALFGARMTVAGMAGDQQAALFGQGCIAAGDSKNTYGTGAFLLVQGGDSRPRAGQGVLVTAACGPGGAPSYALEGSVFIAGAAVQWLRDGLGLIASSEESEGLARSVEDTGGVHFVPAFVGLGTPHWEPEARGTITGLTRGTGRAHLVRAALEAMAHSSADLLEAMATGARFDVPILRVDGGAAANDWLMQFQADVLGIPVERPGLIETTALGAALLAGAAIGAWPDPRQVVQRLETTRFEPRIGPAERADLRAGWSRAVGATLHWARGGGGTMHHRP